MPRSGAEARRRLQEAALELYRDQGYEATTTAQIATAAGVTERTFFRHFADKREVFFDGEKQLRSLWLEALAALPADVAPLPALLAAARTTVPLLEANRLVVERRRPVIAATPALRERELAKVAHLLDVLADALVERGQSPAQAMLAAQVGFAAIARATAAWYEEEVVGSTGSSSSLAAHLEAAFIELGELASDLVVTRGTSPDQSASANEVGHQWSGHSPVDQPATVHSGERRHRPTRRS